MPYLRYGFHDVIQTSLWWRHHMETFSALLAICAGNSPVLGEFPTQSPVTRIFDVFFDLRLNKRLSKQWWGWWFETLSRPLWRHHNTRNLTSHWVLGVGLKPAIRVFQVILYSVVYTTAISYRLLSSCYEFDYITDKISHGIIHSY